jgi:ribokinase
MNVLCAGHVNWDVTLRVDQLPEPDGEVTIRDHQQAGGGSAANVAVNLAGLGADAALFGSIGTDESGTLARRELAESGVRTHLVRADGETAVKYLVVDGDGEVMVLSSGGKNEAFTAEDLREEALETDYLHLTNQNPEVAAALARRAREHDVTVSLAPGRRIADRDFSDALALADFVFVNDREAESLGAEPWGDTLRSDATLVVTLGSEGADVRTPDATYHHPGYDIEPLDTTGAGDAFASGFLAARGGAGRAAATTADTNRDTETNPDTTAAAGGSPAAAVLREIGVAPGEEVGYEDALAVANACGAVASQALGARADLDWGAIAEVVSAARLPAEDDD